MIYETPPQADVSGTIAEREEREHEECFSRNISVFQKHLPEKEFRDSPKIEKRVFRDRLMAGRHALDVEIGVRVPVPELSKPGLVRDRGFGTAPRDRDEKGANVFAPRVFTTGSMRE